MTIVFSPSSAMMKWQAGPITSKNGDAVDFLPGYAGTLDIAAKPFNALPALHAQLAIALKDDVIIIPLEKGGQPDAQADFTATIADCADRSMLMLAAERPLTLASPAEAQPQPN